MLCFFHCAFGYIKLLSQFLKCVKNKTKQKTNKSLQVGHMERKSLVKSGPPKKRLLNMPEFNQLLLWIQPCHYHTSNNRKKEMYTSLY